jgi:hypothetical protein
MDWIPQNHSTSKENIMRNIALLFGLMVIFVGANAVTTATSASYQISVQNEAGVETAKRVLPPDGGLHIWPMVGATVEITTPSDTSDVTELRLYTSSPERKLLHTARISGKALPVRVAYSLCNGHVKYWSPAPLLTGACAVKPFGG